MPAPIDLLDSLRLGGAARQIPPIEPFRGEAKTPSDYVFKVAKAIGRPIGAGLAELGDILSRPETALEEAYGAYQKGRPVLSAAWRGFSEGPSKARYPTFGERIVPEQPGEGLGRKVARIGAEIATDPLTWLGPGIAKAAGKAVVGGARAAAGLEAVQRVGQTEAAQALGRYLIPTVTNLKVFGGKAGGTIGRLAERGEMLSEAATDAEMRPFLEKLRELGLASKNQGARRSLVGDVLETGMPSGDPAVDELASYLKRRFRIIGSEVERGVRGRKFMVRDLEGVKAPFRMVQNYYPEMLKADVLKEMLSQRGLSDAAEKLAKFMKITPEEARTLLQEQIGTVKRAGHIEYSRAYNLPKDMLERDPAEVFPRYVSQVNRRLAMAQEFGVEHERLGKLLQKAVNSGLSEKTASIVRQGVEGRRTLGAFGLENIAPKILGFQVLSKMGPTSTISNLSQQTNTIIAKGLGNYVRGLSRLVADNPMRERAIEAFHRGLQHEAARLVGKAGTMERVMGQSFAERYLNLTGFNWVERGNRMTAYAAGVSSAEAAARDAIAAGKVTTPELKAMGVFPRDLVEFQRTGKLGIEAERRVGLQAAKDTQFTTRWTDLPPGWRTPEMRVAMQFKSFIYQQTRFLLREVMNPAIRYFDTGGREGDIAPLVRALVAYPVAGQGVAALRDLYQEQSARLIGAKRKKPRKFDYKHPVAQLVKDSLYVGTFGMAGDILQQAARGNLSTWLLGPTYSDIAETAQFGAQNLMAGKTPSLDQLLSRIYPHIPGRRVLPLTPGEVVVGAGRRLVNGP